MTDIPEHVFYNSGGAYKTRVKGVKTKECQLWENMRSRIEYLPEMNEGKFGKYSGVTVCDEWKNFQSFAHWFYTLEYYQLGWQLDKDLLSKDNNSYEPDNCVFLPEEVNKALNIKSRARGQIMLGISKHSKNIGKINVQYSCKHPDYKLRVYLDDSQIEYGFSLYKKAREGYIKYLAEKYKDQLDPRAYKALMLYTITKED